MFEREKNVPELFDKGFKKPKQEPFTPRMPEGSRKSSKVFNQVN